MHYDAALNDHGLPFNPVKALIAPRPIGWITALGAQGELNLSPYSFFNLVGEEPSIVAFSSRGYKDAVSFIDETGEFVCNVATWDTREAMNLSSAPLPRGESEVAFAGLTTAPSRFVAPPRVAEAPAALECRKLRTIRLETLEGRETEQFLVLGQVVGVFIDDRFIADGRVDTAAMRPITRAGYHDYFVATPDARFTMSRPTRA